MRALCLLLTALLLSVSAFGQITITRASAFPPGTSIIGQLRTVQRFTSTTDTAGIRALINRSGANQTWDLRAGGRTFASSGTLRYRYLAPSAIPGASVAGANIVQRVEQVGSDTATLSFLNLTDNALSNVAVGLFNLRTNAFLGITEALTPPVTLVQFPVTSTSRWTTTTRVRQQTPGLPAQEVDARYDYAVDGWGTVITPANPNGVQVLQLRLTVATTAVGIPVTLTSVIYNFLDANGNAVADIAEVPGLIPIPGFGTLSVSYSTFSPLSVRQLEGEKPTTFALEQNYPNPFNPSTMIRYSIPSTEQVSLKVFDVLGREVLTLVSGRQAAGRYEVLFNAAGLPSGIYFYRLQAGTYSETRKMMLVK
ncbi:MAG: T9SS type A sorting domain-containing protein [Chloroherpetonaceae bacterium]|nr:T9SS type A sorting domain-containing protein [Chloroherpetonaceae bacterium]